MSENSSSFAKRLFLFGVAVIFVAIALNYAVNILSSIWVPLVIIAAVILVIAVVIITLRNRWR
ncbi:hypothetical protein [Microbacterium sp. NPDC086615]|uniref:hypothetical protein n=1 Tax=Microbacterium sp. NPDC086615 TaxID=3154865 RepID=UPI00342495B3